MPIAVDTLERGPLGTNCYLVRADRRASEAVVVDPSGSAAEIRLELASRGARCVAILITHGHFDHLIGVADLAEGTGAPVYMPAAERHLLEAPEPYTPEGVEIRTFTLSGVDVRAWNPDVLLEGGETLELAGVSFRVIAVPGHSPAHLAYLADGALLSGDVLFAGSVGRVDIVGGDWGTLLASIRTLADTCPEETIVYPGHGPATTLADELAHNPFLGELRAERQAE